MPADRLMRIHSPEFQAMADRVLQVSALTSRLNVLPFEDEAGKAARSSRSSAGRCQRR